ncbi:GNAT family N-acetyltransferase [Streptomyces sp. NPDC018610]|uniref:GNAT family N-acetyltransferase n=1 Tax=Streptomyces sp. NPDC018610 TaxID=3365049 RepID=UPI0037AB716F
MLVRKTTENEQELFLRTLTAAFGVQHQPPAEGESAWWAALETDRGLFAVDHDGAPVGTAGAYTFELTLPGGATVPAPGVTTVGVLPTHRRRGVLTSLMRHQLGRFREEGETLSVLLASEAVIYRRFGYGPAAYSQRLSLDSHRSAFAVPVGTQGAIELRRRADSGELLAEVYDGYRRTQPGALSRPAHWWSAGAGRPPVSHTPRHIALHRDAQGVPDGYASYSVAGTDPVTQTRTLTVDEVVAADDAVHDVLVRYCLDHDLVDTTVFANLSPDHPLRWRLKDFRAARTSPSQDSLWVRLLDVPRALTARRYAAGGELVLEVQDPFLATTDRYRLTVDGQGDAVCGPTDRPADLTLDISDLGSVYLGGTAPSTLVRAGRVRAHHPAAPARADALFLHTDRTPHCLHWF